MLAAESSQSTYEVKKMRVRTRIMRDLEKGRWVGTAINVVHLELLICCQMTSSSCFVHTVCDFGDKSTWAKTSRSWVYFLGLAFSRSVSAEMKMYQLVWGLLVADLDQLFLKTLMRTGDDRWHFMQNRLKVWKMEGIGEPGEVDILTKNGVWENGAWVWVE